MLSEIPVRIVLNHVLLNYVLLNHVLLYHSVVRQEVQTPIAARFLSSDLFVQLDSRSAQSQDWP